MINYRVELTGRAEIPKLTSSLERGASQDFTSQRAVFIDIGERMTVDFRHSDFSLCITCLLSYCLTGGLESSPSSVILLPTFIDTLFEFLVSIMIRLPAGVRNKRNDCWTYLRIEGEHEASPLLN